MKRLIIICFSLLNCCHLVGGGLVETLDGTTKKFEETRKKIFGVIESGFGEKEERLAALEKEKAQLEKAKESFVAEVEADISDIQNQITAIEKERRKEPENEFLNKKLSIFNEHLQVLKNKKKAREELLDEINERIKQLQDYLKDPKLNVYRREHKLDEPPPYSFDLLQNIIQMIFTQERTIASFSGQEKHVHKELESRKQIAKTTSDMHEKKKKELEEVAKFEEPAEPFSLDGKQKTELVRLEEKLYKDKKELAELQLKEIEHSLETIKMKIFIAKLQFDLIKETQRRIKASIRISEAEVNYAKDEHAKREQAFYIKQKEYDQEIEKLSEQQKTKEKELTLLSKRYNISLGNDLDEWTLEPELTIEAYIGLFELGNLNDQILLLKRKRDLLEAYKALEAEKLHYEAVKIEIMDSFRKMATRKFASEEDITQAIKKYDALKAETNANLSLFTNKENIVRELLEIQNRALNNIAKRREGLQQQKEKRFKLHAQEYAKGEKLLNNAKTAVKEQIDILGKIMGVYTDIITTVNTTIKQINFIVAELSTGMIWYRPEHAITWEGIKNITSDVELFIRDVYAYVIHLDISGVVVRIQTVFKRPFSVLWLIGELLFLLIMILLLKLWLPIVTNRLLLVPKKYRGLRTFILLLAVIISFIHKHLIGIIFWLALFIGTKFHIILDSYLYIVFYLFSIPYLLYLFNKFIRFFISFNIQHEYVFLGKEFQKRFVIVFSTFTYATIIIFFFREAFILANYPKSELPNILLALNFILFQISLISLATKEQILSTIPITNELWRWIRTQVDQYYYLILLFVIAIIVMSNPWVGFGRLVLYILSRLLYTALLIRLLFWINGILRRLASRIFFHTEEEVVRERFTYAKTWYGLFVIALFLTFVFLGLIIGAKFWGWPEALTKIKSLEALGELIKAPLIEGTIISTLSIVKIIAFIAIGFLVSFAINRFVLGRIFNLLLVDPGIQNTISSITRYVTLSAFIIIAFYSVDLAGVIAYLYVLILGIGYITKDPLSDFIAYFIILVQRPLKIGDYIKVDEETMGVVRKITPRSVVLRRKNSTTIMVPNSDIIRKSVVNWNYIRGFIAFKDIVITIAYDEDPGIVKDILFNVVSSNSYILKNPKPIVRLENFGEYGYIFLIRGFLSSNYTLDQWDIMSDIRLEIIKVLQEHNIAIALPVRLVIKKGQKEVISHESNDIQQE